MAWIEVHQSLLTHRKTLRLCRLLKLDKYAVTGRLMALWCWALDNAQDGFVHDGDCDLLADVMGWDEPTEKLVTALHLSGFIDMVEEGYQIHDWNDYAGKLIDRRERNKLSMRAARERNKADGVVHVDNTSEPRDDTCKATVQYPTVPNSTVPNTTISSSSAVLANGYQKSSSSKPAPAGQNTPQSSRAPARSPTTTALSKNLSYPEQARWVADVPDDLQLSWTVADRRAALDAMLKWCKENNHKPSEMRYHKWLRDERNHVPENATEVERLEAILKSVNKETSICSNGQTYTNNLGKLREARAAEKAEREREQRRAAWEEAELVHVESSPPDTPS